MSKYELLWNWIQENGTDSFKLSFDDIEKIAGLPIDHSFLNCKKELLNYGYKVGKISLKGKTVGFEKVQGNTDAKTLCTIHCDMYHDGRCILYTSLSRVFRDHGRYAGRTYRV